MAANPLVRAVFFLLGTFAVAVGTGLFAAGRPDEAEEIAFAAVVVGLGLFNLAAGAIGHRRSAIATAAFLADGLFVVFFVWVFSQSSIG